MKAYKVVRKSAGKLRSAVMKTRNTTNLEYKVGEKTVPKIKGSLLLAFTDIERARDFTLSRGLEVYLADVEMAPRDERPTTLINPYSSDLETIKEFWIYRKIAGTMMIPWGTVFCKSITLLEKVELVDDD